MFSGSVNEDPAPLVASVVLL